MPPPLRYPTRASPPHHQHHHHHHPSQDMKTTGNEKFAAERKKEGKHTGHPYDDILCVPDAVMGRTAGLKKFN